MSSSHSILLAATVLLASCQESDPPPPPPTPEEQSHVRTTGSEVAARLVKTLGTQMKTALESGGPVAAVTVCQNAAQPLTNSVTGDAPEISVRRTSLRVRNPINAPDPLDRSVLQEFESSAPDQRPDEIVKWSRDSARYYKPLTTQDVCTKCHGNPETFSPALRDLLRETYPDDHATGFAVGELRGVIRVDFRRPVLHTDPQNP